jgi:hypothetical protein
MPEYPGQENNPDREKMYKTTRGSVYDAIANDVVPWADVSPETLKLWVGYVFGGAGRFVGDSASTAMGAAKGEFDIEKAPIANKFIAKNDVEEYRSRFYEQTKEVEAISAKYHYLKRQAEKADGDRKLKLIQERATFQKEHADELALGRDVRKQRDFMKLQADKLIEARDADDREEMARIEQVIITRAKIFAQRYNKAMP